jgi:hypothetical protein
MTTLLSTQLPLPSRFGLRCQALRIVENKMTQAIIKGETHLTINQSQILSENKLYAFELLSWKDFKFSRDEFLSFVNIASQDAIKVTQNQLAYAQNGIAALTVYGCIDSDPTSWDMNHMALLGYYLEKNFQDENKAVYEFNLSTASWTRLTDGEEFNFHPESGEPVLNYGDVEVIKGLFV